MELGLENYNDEDLLHEIFKRHCADSAPRKTERYVPHMEVLVPVGNDNTVYITMTDETYKLVRDK